jgi:hypothetical protein
VNSVHIICLSRTRELRRTLRQAVHKIKRDLEAGISWSEKSGSLMGLLTFPSSEEFTDPQIG